MKKTPIRKNKTLADLFKKLKKIPFFGILKKYLISPLKAIITAAGFWKIACAVLFAIFFLYYPIGAMRTNKINTDTTIEITPPSPQSSAVIETMAYLINREINDHFWTPNLPFFFPSYILDNMPNYQLGIMSSLANFSTTFAKKVDRTPEEDNKFSLLTASKFINYPGTIWVFSPDNKLTPATSANSQYRKAHRILGRYNKSLDQGSKIFARDSSDLATFLYSINADLSKVTKDLDTHIREESSSIFDFKSDNVFFFNKGKVYANYMILKALTQDYKDIILSHNLYPNFVSAIKALEFGLSFEPTVIRNAELKSSTAPNHLMYLGYFALKAQNAIQEIITSITPVKEYPIAH